MSLEAQVRKRRRLLTDALESNSEHPPYHCPIYYLVHVHPPLDYHKILDDELTKVTAVNTYEPSLQGGVKTDVDLLQMATESTKQIMETIRWQPGVVGCNLRDMPSFYVQCAEVARSPLFIKWARAA